MKDTVNLFILIGIPGSGKSTWAEQTAKVWKFKVISSDAIRRRLEADSKTYTNNDIFKRMFDRTIRELDAMNNVIYDATNIERHFRKKTIERIREHMANSPYDLRIVGVVFDTPLDVCLNRNDMRQGVARVPEDVIRRMNKKYDKPKLSEGFDEIIYMNN